MLDYKAPVCQKTSEAMYTYNFVFDLVLNGFTISCTEQLNKNLFRLACSYELMSAVLISRYNSNAVKTLTTAFSHI